MANIISLNEVYSIIFFITSAVFLLTGTYVLSSNIKSVLNRTFFYMALSLGIWAFSYSIANSALTEAEAILWNRVSVFGWGLMYSIQLHYFLLLTDRSSLFENKASYLIIYFPALINIIYFSLDPSLAPQQYSLVKTNAGWVDVKAANLLNYYFYAYYVVNTLISLICLWSWKRVKEDKNAKMTVIIITAALFSGVLIGSITDVLFKNSLQELRPHLGVVFGLIPVFALLYSTKKYGITMKADRDDSFGAGKLFTQRKRMSFFRMLSYIFIGGSTAYILLDFFMIGKEITGVLKFSALILLMGIHIGLVPYHRLSMEKEDLLIGILMVSVMPLLYLHFRQYGYNSVIWTVALFLMTISTVFSSRKILISVLTSGVLVESLVYIGKDPFVVTIGKHDFQQRLAIYLLLGGLIFYVSYLYRSRLKDHEDQIRLQGEISRLSSEFISINPDNLDQKINEMLKTCGEFFNIDHSYLFRVTKNGNKAQFSNEWCSEDLDPGMNNFSSINIDSFPWFFDKLRSKNTIYIDELGKLPEEALSEFGFLNSQGIKSMICVPVLNNDSLLGFLGFASIKSKRPWSLEHQEVLRIMGNILSDSLVKTESEQRINFMAYYDSLTGLPNRTYFNMELEKMISLAERNDKLMGILFLDLDLFKSVNDTMGHEAGDSLLITVAERFNQIVRKSDMVCRFGGDEFIVMLPLMEDEDQIRTEAEKLMDIFREPVSLRNQEFTVTASCGVAVYPYDGETAEKLIKNADLAMYESKNAGKNRYTLCTPIMKQEITERVELSNDLYRALERDELLLYYQPQVSIETDKIVGVEALIRWDHPKRGIISPGLFIPLAEQTGLIHSIGEWVLKTACSQNKSWQEKGYAPVVIAVNLSVEQFRSMKLIETVSTTLEQTGLDPEYLELEITESIAINEPEYIIDMLQKLREIGVSIAIDDFGTEYSSLSRLKSLPIDKLKMAMEFVQGIDKETKDEAIASVIINLARSLGLKVIAEGVEKENQYRFFKDRVCDEVQGYYFYRPMPAEAMERIMEESMLGISGKTFN